MPRASELVRVMMPEMQWASALELPPQGSTSVLAVGLALNLQVLVHDGEIGLRPRSALGNLRTHRV